jgi:hypothetical protein
MSTQIVTFGPVQSWYNPTPNANQKSTSVETTMAKFRSQQHSQMVSQETKDINQKRSNQGV